MPSASVHRKRKRGDDVFEQRTHPAADQPPDLSFAELARNGTCISRKRKRVADGSEQRNLGKAVSEKNHEHHSSLTPVGAVPPVSISGKRKRDGRVPEESSNKRPKGPQTSRWNSTTTHHAPGFWDTLSQIFLSRRALQEFDRRNALARTIAKKTPSQISQLSRKGYIEGSTLRRASPDLKRFARAGGPDLSDIKEYPLPRSIKMTRTRSSSRLASQNSNMGPPNLPASRARPPAKVDVISNTGTSMSGKSNAYDNNFMTQLAHEGVQPLNRDHEPANIHEWKRRLAQPRAALSSENFSEARHKTFLRAMDSAFSEGKVVLKLFPTIIGDAEYHSDVNRPCMNWEAFGDANLVIPQPDYLEGARQSAQNEEVRQELGPMIMPFAAYEALFLPNFFTEAKGLRGTLDVAQRQACYDGALGTRCMHVLQNLGSERKMYDGNAYTITSTYVGDTLKLFLHHITPPKSPEHKPNYHMTPLKGWLLEDYDTFLEGVSWYQNARDVADGYRQQFLEAARSRLRAAAQERSLSVSSDRTPRTVSGEETAQDHVGSETSPNNSDIAQVPPPTTRSRKLAAGAESKPKNKVPSPKKKDPANRPQVPIPTPRISRQPSRSRA